jgi:hypothetical protein
MLFQKQAGNNPKEGKIGFAIAAGHKCRVDEPARYFLPNLFHTFIFGFIDLNLRYERILPCLARKGSSYITGH